MHISKTEINNFLNGLNKAKGYPKTKIEWVASIVRRLHLIKILSSDFRLNTIGDHEIDISHSNTDSNYRKIKDISPQSNAPLEFFPAARGIVFGTQSYKMYKKNSKLYVVTLSTEDIHWFNIEIKVKFMGMSNGSSYMNVIHTHLNNFSLEELKEIHITLYHIVNNWKINLNKKRKALQKTDKLFLIEDLIFDDNQPQAEVIKRKLLAS
jgi:hypothetical protein